MPTWRTWRWTVLSALGAVASSFGCSGPDQGRAFAEEGPPLAVAAPTPASPSPVTSRTASTVTCNVPPLAIPRTPPCTRGRGYPSCKWQMPAAPGSGGRYRRWRNTVPEHWWGRPSLVAFLLAAIDDFRAHEPGQVVAVGDLDAMGPRHQTHDHGVDVDLYLPGALLEENEGGGRYVDNYADRTSDEIEAMRGRVEGLARSLARCAAGRIRIYYNDSVVVSRFNEWFRTQGYESPFGPPMQEHNELHRFHFHVTIADDLALLPQPVPPAEPHPIVRIESTALVPTPAGG